MSHDGHHGHHMPQEDVAVTASLGDHSGHLMGTDTTSSHPMGGMHGMAMYFHFGFEQYILFEQWTAQSDTTLVLTCLFFFLLAIVYEILKAYRRVVALRLQVVRESDHLHRHRSGHSQHIAAHVGPTSSGADNGGDVSAGSSLSQVSTGNGHQKLVPESSSSSKYVMDPTVASPDDPIAQSAQHASYVVPQPQSPGHISMASSSRGIPLFSTRRELLSLGHLLSTLLYMLQVLFAYLLMLAFMLFNVWICLAILIGAGFGHFLLAHKAIALQDHTNEDYCH